MTKRLDLHVAKSNHLVEATFRLSLAELRVLSLVISRLDSREPLDFGIAHTITAQEMSRAYDLPLGQAYELLTDGVDRLYERSLRIHVPGADPTKPPPDTRWISMKGKWLSRGSVELRFAPDIIPYLTQLTREFTRYQLRYIASMTSTYSIRLYEMLAQWRSAGTREVGVAWLRERLDLDEKYSNIRDLKRFVIVRAVSQINAHSDLRVTWTQKKTGRQVTSFVFTFGPKPDDKPTPRALTRAEIEANARPGETWDEAKARLSRP